MKHRTLVALVLLVAPLARAAAGESVPAGLYGQRIVMDNDEGKGRAKPPGKIAMKAIADDLANWLGRATGKTFGTVNVATEGPRVGIILVKANSRLAPEADRVRLRDKGKEAFVLRSEDGARLWIVGNTDLAVRHGVYHYLERVQSLSCADYAAFLTYGGAGRL